MKKFKNLKIWQEAVKIVLEVYKLTKQLPDEEKFGLVSQMRRCSVSIPSNISEGSSKSTDKHFNKYLEVSLGSAFEWETQLIIALNENYLSEEKFKELEQKIKQIQKMISSFQSRLKT